VVTLTENSSAECPSESASSASTGGRGSPPLHREFDICAFPCGRT
jgi:hypothetical protein